MWIQVETNLLTLLRDTGPVARGVLAILLIFSVWSWGIILSKLLLLQKVSAESEVFWKMFRKGQTLLEVSTAAESLRFTPLGPVLNAAVDIMKPRPNQSVGALAVKTQLSSGAIQRAMQRAASAQLTRLESRLTFLATTAAVAPFIGLFGTVWGILTSFMGLSNAGAASLRAVAPGIAEALITTAFGLFAAIPAVIAYNQFVYRIRNIGGQLDDLQSDVLAVTERDGQ